MAWVLRKQPCYRPLVSHLPLPSTTYARCRLGKAKVSAILLRPCLKTGEAEARRLNQDPGLYFYGVSDADMQLWPELPELRGPAGALELMRQQWGQQAQTFDDLDTGPLANVAILDADAVRLAVLLFGAPSPVSRASPASAAVVTAPETAPVPAPPVSDSFLRDPVQPAALTLVSIAPAMPVRDAQARKDLEAKARAEFKRAKDPADLWGAQHFAELLRQFNLLTAKVPGRLNVQPAHDLLSEIWGIAPASVKTYLTKARAQPQHAEGLAAG